jgi:hypothetical protein
MNPALYTELDRDIYRLANKPHYPFHVKQSTRYVLPNNTSRRTPVLELSPSNITKA